ncbi:MAG: hypothetical protein ACPGYV_13580 [Phycisphaeraceae bacterium]
MSDTAIDMAKVTQMLDNGWEVNIYRGGMGGYVAAARHKNLKVWAQAKQRMLEQMQRVLRKDDPDTSAADAYTLIEADMCEEGLIDTEDFTPEQALTRLAYKVHGETI